MTKDRTGEEIPEEPPPHTIDDECSGWLGEDHEGRPIPCPVHKPWATEEARRRKVWGYDS
jgi:hypothetical protein